MDIETKYDLISKDLAEIRGNTDIMKKILNARKFKIYWGTAPTGEIHVGYFAPIKKLVDYQKADCEVTILIADQHALFDSMKSTKEQVPFRTEYYKQVLSVMIDSIGGNSKDIIWIIGSSFQRSSEYLDIMEELKSIASVNDCIRAGSEVVKHSDNPTLGSIEYPLMQVADEIYLRTDAQAGGLDQRKIMLFGKDLVSKIKSKHGIVAEYKKKQVFHLMSKMIPSLSSKSISDLGGSYKKMSASDGSKIGIFDENKTIAKKIGSTFCEPLNIEDNTILFMIRDVIFPLLEHLELPYIIERSDEYGGTIIFKTYDELKMAFCNGEIHPIDIKKSLSNFLFNLMEPLRKLKDDNKFLEIYKKAYT